MHNLTPQQKQINAINAIIEDVEALAVAAQSIPHYLVGDNRVTTYQLAVLDIR